MPTKAETKTLSKPIKLKVRRGDRVMIISGKDKGEVGVVITVSPKESRLLVVKENPANPEEMVPLNAMIKHQKAKQQGERSSRRQIPGPIHVSNVMVLDPATNKPTRVGKRIEDGKLVRYAKGSGQLIPRPAND